ncbi:relaxase/mobilization nuclease domain-containing protein [Glutamicibacter ardleyensis]|uniref:relaxase/mobilization nuclease domain-containing protein n=1 Tax=Glutamicibacter ardleyensis TaxID=225894 RepID=UPI003FD30CF7
MIPNVTSGGRMAGLMNYLVGPGRANEHENQRLIAGDDRVTFSYAPGTELSKYEAFDIAEILDAPRKAFGTEVTKPVYAKDEDSGAFLADENGKKIRVGSKDSHVWHCSLSLAESEGSVSDAQWKNIAESFMQKMGFVDLDGAKSSRWAAVHHGASKNGNDHIHLVVQMVREDGTKASTHNDFHRAQLACRELEAEYALQSLESSATQQQGLSGEKPAERERATRESYAVSDRMELSRRMRSALATSTTAHEFVRQLPQMGVQVAPRFAKDSTSKVTGYKVSLGTKTGEDQAVWYAPSKLDRSLSWPSIKARFDGAGVAEAEQFLAGRHSSARLQRASGYRAFDLAQSTTSKLNAGQLGPDTLANVYARLSLELEGNKPGSLAVLSTHMARAGQNMGNRTYAARLASRFSSRSAEQGWMAVLRQANRLSQTMLRGRMATERPRLTQAAQEVVAMAEKIVRDAENRTSVHAAAPVGQRMTKKDRDQCLGR